MLDLFGFGVSGLRVISLTSVTGDWVALSEGRVEGAEVGGIPSLLVPGLFSFSVLLVFFSDLVRPISSIPGRSNGLWHHLRYSIEMALIASSASPRFFWAGGFMTLSSELADLPLLFLFFLILEAGG